MTTRRRSAALTRAWFPDELDAALAAVAASNGDLADAVWPVLQGGQKLVHKPLDKWAGLW